MAGQTRQQETSDVMSSAYHHLFERMSDAVLVLDLQDRILDLNPAARQMLRCTDSDLAGQPAARVIAVWPRLIAQLGEQKQAQIEIELDGQAGERHLQLSLSLLEDQDGQAAGRMVILRDITALKQAEAALHESEHHLDQVQRVLGTMADGPEFIVAAQDTELRYIFFNEAYKQEIERLAGQEIHVGSSMIEAFARLPEQQAVAVQQWRRTLQGEGANYQIEFGDPGRYRRVYDVRQKPLRDPAGNVVGAIEVAHDITERVQAEKALRESEERFRIIYDTAPVSIWQEDWTDIIAAVDGLRVQGVTDWAAYFRDHPEFVADMLRAVKILDVNQWTVDMFGARQKSEMLASLGTVFSTPDTLPGFVAELTALAEGRQTFGTEMTVNTVQGDVLHVLLAMSFPPRGSTSGQVLVSTIDITERKHNEEQVASLARFPGENPNPILRLSQDGTILYANGSASVLLNEWNRKVGETAPPDWQQTIQKALWTGSEQFQDVRCGPRIYLVAAVPISEGGYVNLYGRDVTLEREGQARLEAVFAAIPDVILEYDAGGRMVRANEAAFQAAGLISSEFTRDESVARLKFTNLDGSAIQREDLPTSRALQGETVSGDLYRITTADGIERVISTYAAPLYQDGEVDGVVALWHDITELKRAEEVLRETQQLTSALNRINETIHASLDPGEIMQHLIGEGVAALGCDTAAISLRQAGQWTVSYIHGMPEGLVGTQIDDDLERHTMLAIRTRQPVAIADTLNDDRVNREHMRRYNVRAVLVAPLIVRGEPFGALFLNYHSGPHWFSEAQVHFAAQLATTAAIALDNSRLFEERKQSEEQLRTTLESIGDGFFAVDDNWRFVYVNAQAERLLGIGHDEVLGQNHWEVFPLTLGTRLEREYRRAAAGEVRDFENFYEPWGHWYHNRCFPRRGGGMSVYFEDITERKQVQARVQQQNAILKAVSHILEATLLAPTEEELGEACLTVVEEITGSRFGFIGEIGADGLLHAIALSDPGWEACQVADATNRHRPLDSFQIHGIYGRVVMGSKGFWTNDPDSHPDRIGTPPGHPPLTSFLGVPLFRDRKTIGIMAVGNRQEGYDDRQLEALEALAPVIIEALMRKRAEAEAEEGKRTLDALMDSVPEGITIASAPDVEIRMVSRHGQELLGAPHASLTVEQVAEQWKVYRLDGVTPLPDADLPLVRAIQQGETVRDFELIQIGTTGQRLVLSCNAGPIRDGEGHITGGVVAWRNVTELRAAERRHSRILASAMNGFALLNARGQICEVNQALCRMLDYSRAELLTMTIADVEVVEDETTVQGHIATVRQKGFDHFDTQHRRRDGTIIDVEVTSTFHESGGGQVASFFQDITARKQAEEELRQNREWLRVTLTSIGDAVLATDADRCVTFLNPVAESLTGWTGREVLGQPIQQVFRIIDEKTRQPGEDLYARVLSERKPIMLANHTVLLARDGREIPIEDSAAPILDAEGSVTGVVLVFHDVTDKRRAQQALRESDERFRSVLENSLDAAYRRDLQTDRYDYMSPVFETITGWSVDELNRFGIGGVLGLIHPDDLATVEREIERTTAACQDGLPATGTLEYRFRGKDGAYLWLGDHINVLPGSNGQPLYRLGIVRDITPPKQWEQELRRLNRTLQAHSHSDQALLRATTKDEYMQEVCRIIVEDCGHALVWIGLARDDEYKSIQPVAYAGFEAGYLDTMHLTWADTERGRGPAGRAVRTGRPAVCHDTRTEPDYEPWRQEALQRGYASSLVLPLLDGDPHDGGHATGRAAFGALTIYFREPDPFTDDEIALLSGLADDLAYGIRMIWLREAHGQAEEALRQSEERYRHLFNSMTEGFALHEIILDANGKPCDYRFLEINPAFEKLTGLKREDLMGRAVLEVLPGTEPFWIETYGHVALTGEPIHFEQHSSVLDRYYEVFSFRPAENQFAALFLDVTARKQAEDALHRVHEELEHRVRERTAELQASEERFRQLAENINEVFWMLEPQTWRPLYISPAYNAIWGRSPQELHEYPLSFLDTVHPDDREILVQEFNQDWQAYDKEFRILRPDGTLRWIQIRSFPVYDDAGQAYRLAGVAVDRTEQKAAESALLQAERLTIAGKMAASLAHEINNPLQAVIGCLGLAEGALQSNRDPSKYLKIAHQEVQRTARIVGQLRALGRPIQDGQQEPTDLNLLLSDVLLLNKKHLESKRIEVTWEPGDDLPLLLLTPDPIRQVFLNLVLNAAEAMPTGGRLRLSTELTTSPDGVQVEVTDSGSGIPSDVLPHIFEAFYSTKTEGMGMGLFVSQNIVKEHGGWIEVESEAGEGTIFTIWLPA